MKLTYFQLAPHLTKNLSPIYVISGDELLLKQEAISLIRKAAQQAGFTERVRMLPTEEDIYQQLYSPSLMAGKRLIELDCRQSLPNKAAAAILQEYAGNPSPDQLLLVDMPKADDKATKSAWYSAFEKAGILVTIWPLPREQLPQWIMDRVKKYQLTMHPDATNLLADYTEGNLSAAAQTIEKIRLLQPQKTIDVELLQSILTDEGQFNVFDFVEKLIASDQAQALHILNHLQSENTEPTLVLWAITRELRMLAEMATLLKQGTSYDTLLQKFRIFGHRQQAIRRFLGRGQAHDCSQYLMQAAQIDRIIKGAAPGNVWDQLQLFCLRLV